MKDDFREKGFAILRIIFGGIWLIDAYFKWNPDFISGFVGYLQSGARDQPFLIQQWINFWIKAVNINPYFFAILVALAETAIALSLLSGVLSKIAMYGGASQWHSSSGQPQRDSGEGFGGAYAPGSTDVGSAVIYILVFAALLLGKSWRRYNAEYLFHRIINPLSQQH